jgi:hypothetical protein
MPRDPAASQPRSRPERRAAAAESMVVIEPLNPWTCTGCGGSGSLLLMEDAGPLCMGCADLDHLVFLPAGDAALSDQDRRRASSSRTGWANPWRRTSPTSANATPGGGGDSVTLPETSTRPAPAWAAIRAARLTVRPK